MKIAITGANSFIGKRLIHKISELNWDIVAVVRKGCSQKDVFRAMENVAVYECNMDEYHQLGDMIGTVDCFVHLAWSGTRGTSRLDEELQYKNYCWSMEAIQSLVSKGCRRIITAGSQAEYGINTDIISEKTECNPNTAYGKYKLRVYQDTVDLCRKYGVAYKEPRFFSLYGPEDYENSLIVSCLQKFLNNIPCELTECIQMWDYLYIDDAIDALVKLCYIQCEDGAYNFGSGDCRELKSFVQEMKEITNSSSELIYGVVPYTAAGVVSIQPDTSKLKREAVWNAKISFEQGIKEILLIRFGMCFD